MARLLHYNDIRMPNMANKNRAPSAKLPRVKSAAVKTRHGNLAMFAVLVIVISVVYSRALRSPFIFDDRVSVQGNPSIRQLWPLIGSADQPGPLSPLPQSPTAGRPLVNLTLALNYSFGQLNPIGYHLFNLVIHILSAFVLGRIVARTIRLEYFGGRFDRVSERLALIAALLWAIHPLQTEAVVYVTQRTELMVGLFYLTTLYASLRYWSATDGRGARIWLALATLACLAGMASKEVMVTAPLLILLFERSFVRGSFREALIRSSKLYIGLAMGWLLLFGLNWNAPRSLAGFHYGVSPYVWWLTQTKVFMMYLKLVFWPWPLIIHYRMPYLTSAAAAAPFLVPVGALIILTLLLLWQRSGLGFVGAWVFLVLSPTLVVPIIREVAAERRMYLPLAALSALAVIGGHWAIRKAERLTALVPRHSPTILAIISVFLLSFLNVRRLNAYQTDLGLWQDAALHEPDDGTVQNNMGWAYFEQGQYDQAIRTLERAVRQEPDVADFRENLANAYAHEKRYSEALAELRHALSLKPEDPAIHMNLGIALKGIGDIDGALVEYQTALRLRPSYAEALRAMALIYLDSKNYPKTIELLNLALKADPLYFDAYVDRGTAYVNMEEYEEGATSLVKAIEVDPTHPNLYEVIYDLGLTYMHLNSFSQAKEEFLKALELRPDFAPARTALLRLR